MTLEGTRLLELHSSFYSFLCMFNQSINEGLFSIQTNNNNNNHTFVYMNTERAGNEVKLLI